MSADKLIQYTEPSDVALLFNEQNMSETLAHILNRFIDKARESEKYNTDYVYECIATDKHEMMQIDYLFIVKCLSELCVYSDDFIQDFKIKGEDRRGQKTVKNGLFLTHGVLEVLHNLVFMNGTKTMKYGLNQYVPQVVQRGEKEMIIAGVNFKRNSVKLALNDDKLWDEFYSYISDGKTNFIPGTFGLKGAYEYFKKLNKDVVYLNS